MQLTPLIDLYAPSVVDYNQTTWLYCVECPQYSIRLEGPGYFCKAVYFLHSTRPRLSRDSIVDGDWLPATEWCQRYLLCYQPASDVAGHWGGVSCTECTGYGNDFEL